MSKPVEERIRGSLKEDYIVSRTEVKAAIADIEKELDRLECQEGPEQESEICEWSEVLEQMTAEMFRKQAGNYL